MPGPITLTRQQFRQTKAARKKGATYESYLRYVANRRGSKLAAKPKPVDPFAPLNDRQIRSRAAADVSSQVDPLVADITRSINTRTKAGVSSITANTNALARSLGALEPAVQRVYGGAQQEQAATENALAQRLSGAGTELSGELSGKLAAINAPGAPAAQVADVGQAGSNALFGRGAASLGQLIASGAAERSHAAKQPGIARLSGQQAVRTLQSESSRELADQVGEVRSRVPGLIRDLIGSYRDAELDKGIARAGFAKDRQAAQLERQDIASQERVARAEIQAKRQERLEDYEFELAKERRAFERDMAKAELEWERSRKDKAAERRFEARQKTIERRFDARQKDLDRKARASLEKQKAKGKTKGKTGSGNPLLG